MDRYFVTGTDTDVGKTVASAWLVQKLKAHYWKPVQSGCIDTRDLETVMELAGCERSRIFDSVYELQEPLSPHEAAVIDGVEIDMDKIVCPEHDGPLIVEGAGGILVPLNDQFLMIDLMKKLALPVIVVARSALGTINHTLMTLRLIEQADLSIKGVIMMGDSKPNNRKAIEHFSKVPVIAEIPYLHELNKEKLNSVDFGLDM